MRNKIIFLIGILVSSFPIYSFASSDAWDKFREEYNFQGFIQTTYSQNIESSEKKVILGETRLQTEIRKWFTDTSSLFLKSDFALDLVESVQFVDIREAYLEFLPGAWDIKIGKQIITWGVGDRIFLNDVFPKDWVSFLGGRPLQYLKIGNNAIVADYSGEFGSLELITIPYFQWDNFPLGDRFQGYKPLDIPVEFSKKSASATKNWEYGIRWNKEILSSDFSLYLFRGFYKTPGTQISFSLHPGKLTYIFPPLQVYGMSLQRNMFGGVISAEYAYYDSLRDRKGDNPFIINSSWKGLVGYNRELAQDLRIGIQYYQEETQEYSNYEDSLPPGSPHLNKVNRMFSVNLDKEFLSQTLKLSIFGIYNPEYKESLLQPSIKYEFTDNFWVQIGANLFNKGTSYSYFGQFTDYKNVYLTARWRF